MNVLVEGIGSMVFNTQLKYYKELGWNIIGIDIESTSSGLYRVSKPYIVPKYTDKNCFNIIEEIIKKEKIDIVIPSVNEGLLGWSIRKNYFWEKYGTKVMISNKEVISTCVDKWETYKFFIDNNIPTPRTSLLYEYDLIKPRVGRGSTGIYKKSEISKNINMENYISQEIVSGEEYTIDILCDLDSNPIYIVPRIRLGVESGVSVKGKVVPDIKITNYCKKIISLLKPIGIINIQCFKKGEEIYFIEINPRIAGGSSLSFAASDNWFKAIECFATGQKYIPKEIQYNKYMFRIYEDVIVDEKDLINGVTGFEEDSCGYRYKI